MSDFMNYLSRGPSSLFYMLGKQSFSLRSIYAGHHNYLWRGVPCLKSPFDIALYQMLISEIRPDLVVEIGTHTGGGALFFADLLELFGENGEVHTIDVADSVESHEVLANSRIRRFLDGWQNYPTEFLSQSNRVLIVDDGAHTREQVLGALNRFAPHLSTGDYFAVEDGILSFFGWGKRYGGGPLSAIRHFLKANPDFKVDSRWTDFYGKDATFNPKGFLVKA